MQQAWIDHQSTPNRHMELHLLRGRRGNGLVSFGTLWPRGAIAAAEEEDFAAGVASGARIPMQSRVAARWPDGSAKWVRHTARAEEMGETVRILPGEKPERPSMALRYEKDDTGTRVDTGRLRFSVPAAGGEALLRDISLDGELAMTALRPVFLLSHVEETEERTVETILRARPKVTEVLLEEAGEVALTFLYRGFYVAQEEKMRFEIRLTVSAGAAEIKAVNTFFFHGDPGTDRMKGLGLEGEVLPGGEAFHRHIRFVADRLVFHEPAQILESRISHTGPGMKRRQLAEEIIAPEAGTPEAELTEKVRQEVPIWNQYRMDQTGQGTCVIRKRTRQGFCAIDAYHGRKGNGAMAVSGTRIGCMVGLRDFWQRYPSALQVDNLGQDVPRVTAWFWSPEAPAMDFRHYDDRSYPANYEGFEYFGADPEGIAVTSEACFLLFTPGEFGAENEGDKASTGINDQIRNRLLLFAEAVQKPPVYTASPEVYHQLKAFGEWSLPDRGTPEGERLEHRLDQAIAFYKQEQERQGWYGFFDYGDFRHSYDPDRHTWKYDIGGWAWQQTELVPTYWLWLQFLRTGREDIFSLAEAMSRNTMEVDCYHFGPLKGLGSRHNVRHWGCPCKEPRVSMAGHHRPLYYLTGDLRTGQCMEEMASAHEALAHTRWYAEEPPTVRCRTAPDWTSLLSDWMTAYERTLNPAWKALADKGIASILNAPMGFGSGPIFHFRPESGEMIYIGEDTGNIHLTQCFATLQILLEAAEAMDLPSLRDFCVDYGQIYMMTPEERTAKFGDLVAGKGYSMRYTASGMGAYSGMIRNDPETRRRAWRELLLAAPERNDPNGFVYRSFQEDAADRESHQIPQPEKPMEDIPWLSTNYVSQWCLNAIMVLAFAKEDIPPLREMERLCGEDYRLEL
mgnify:CR=1 FL=1